MVDLSKLKEGDTVKFRCGGEAVVKVIDNTERGIYRYGLTYEDAFMTATFSEGDRYQVNGSFQGTAVKHPFDIVEVIPAPFNWADVKPGMCFTGPYDDSLYYFIGRDPIDPNAHVFTEKDGRTISKASYIYDSYNTSLKQFVRAPEHDIEVAG